MVSASSIDPYAQGKVSLGAFAQKSVLKARVVAVLRGQVMDRGMELIPQLSRAIREGDIHEIVVTDTDVSSGSTVSRISYVAFVEFECGGVLLRGDNVSANGNPLGELLGFDLSHFPNHMNLIVHGRLKSGEDLGIRVGDIVEFTALWLCNT